MQQPDKPCMIQEEEMFVSRTGSCSSCFTFPSLTPTIPKVYFQWPLCFSRYCILPLYSLLHFPRRPPFLPISPFPSGFSLLPTPFFTLPFYCLPFCTSPCLSHFLLRLDSFLHPFPSSLLPFSLTPISVPIFPFSLSQLLFFPSFLDLLLPFLPLYVSPHALHNTFYLWEFTKAVPI